MEAVKDPDSGRREFIERVVAEHYTALLRLCYIQLQDQSLAEDAVQETFLKAYRAFDQYRGDCSEKSWLCKIAVNTCRDMLRGGWFRHIDRRVSLESLPEPAGSRILCRICRRYARAGWVLTLESMLKAEN